jgi:putative FmdB family regulatory protein
MPLYEYVCLACGKKTEVIQRLNEKPLRICPHCAGRLKKAASAPAIQFKGSGWYVTDYARGKKEEKPASSERTEAEPKPAESGKKKSVETKPETRKESKKTSS